MQTARSRDLLSDLAIDVAPLSPETRVSEVADLFLSEQYNNLLCLPVVEQGRVLGTISRYAIIRIFLQPFGREIFGPRPVARFLNEQPLLIDHSMDVEKASGYVRANIEHPITEDFVILEQGHYAGMGMVLSLLELMEKQVERRNRALAVANKNLKASQARLVQSEKMASLGQMVAGVAHEINTPLGYASSNIELLRDFFLRARTALESGDNLIRALLDPDTEDHQLGQVLAAAVGETESLREDRVLEDIDSLIDDSMHGLEQIGELVVSLRNFSRLDRAKIDRVNINECIDSALTIGKNIIKHRAEVILDYQDEVTLECSPSQINQVLLNILTNAAQAIEGEGKIRVRTRADDEQVIIAIRDNGCGIPDDVRRRIFDPFFTTKPVGEGTGLGLSISFQIVRQHGGTIEVSSRPGAGTEFIIRLPRRQESNDKAESRQQQGAMA